MTQKQPQEITIEDFSRESSIHGIKFIADSNSHKSVRLFWTVSFILSIAGFIYYAHEVYLKWSSNPDITLKIKWKSIREIPFPAMTICLPLFAKSKSIKLRSFTKIRNTSVTASLSPKDQSIVAAAAQACNPHVSSRISRFLPKSSSINFIEYLQQSSPTINEAFGACFYNRNQMNCEDSMKRVLFDSGICYTYNIQGYSTIFREEIISKDFDSYKGIERSEKNSSNPDWSIFNGYSTISDNVYPKRATKNGVATFYPKIDKSDMENICLRYGKGFRLIFHSPNEIATFPHSEYFIPFDQERQITIGAKYTHYSKDLKIYSPEKRQCYFENERKLNFFKSYSKNHCLVECLTTFTLRKCGCVKFSMPRAENTPICDLTKISCYIEALNQWPYADNQGAKTLMPCDCFQPCNDISYTVKHERIGEIEPKIQNMTKGAIYSEIGIKFNDILIEEQDFFVGYKLQNFIADTGGLLGLFMGCSILSIVELLYYFIKGFYRKYQTYKIKVKKVSFLTRAGQPIIITSLHNDYQSRLNDLDFLKTIRRGDSDIYILKRPLYEREDQRRMRKLNSK